MFYPLQIIKNKEMDYIGTFIKVLTKKDGKPWLIKVRLEDGPSITSTAKQWEAATLPSK
jgi:argonaute-like protein implicated in RNA metabolism and viral defense